jgi:hypothetical protein
MHWMVGLTEFRGSSWNHNAISGVGSSSPTLYLESKQEINVDETLRHKPVYPEQVLKFWLHLF